MRGRETVERGGVSPLAPEIKKRVEQTGGERGQRNMGSERVRWRGNSLAHTDVYYEEETHKIIWYAEKTTGRKNERKNHTRLSERRGKKEIEKEKEGGQI